MKKLLTLTILLSFLLTACNKDWDMDGWRKYKIKAGRHFVKHVPKPRSTAGELETNFYFNETFYYDPDNLFTEDGDSCGNGYSKVIGIVEGIDWIHGKPVHENSARIAWSIRRPLTEFTLRGHHIQVGDSICITAAYCYAGKKREIIPIDTVFIGDHYHCNINRQDDWHTNYRYEFFTAVNFGMPQTTSARALPTSSVSCTGYVSECWIGGNYVLPHDFYVDINISKPKIY